MWLFRLIAGLSVVAAGAGAQDFGGALDVALAVGAENGRVTAGQPFRVTARLGDPETGQPVEDAHLSGWIRPVTASNSGCSEAARGYFVNQGALPRGETDLGRSLYGVLHEDGNLSVVDWEHALASANIRAMLPVPRGVTRISALPEAFAFGLTAENGAWQVPASENAQPMPLAASIAQITANGWLLHRDGRIVAPSGESWLVSKPAVQVRPALPDEDARHQGVIVLGAERADLFRLGAAPQSFAAPEGARDVGHSQLAEAAFFVDGSDSLWMSYGASPPFKVPLAAPADRVSVAPDGRLAITWSPASRAVSVVDIATAAVVQGVDLNRAPMNQPVREVAFAGTAAFLLLEKLDFVMVVSLDRARRGQPAAVRAVRLGPPVTDLPDGAGPFLLESRRGHDAGAVLALHPDLSTAFPVSQDSGNATAPMNGFRIRGARPLGFAELNVALDEVAPGRYAAATVLEQGGRYELIVSGGPGSFTSCAQFDVEGQTAERLDLRLLAEAKGDRVELLLLAGDGTRQKWPAALPVAMQALESSWRSYAVTHPISAERHMIKAAGLPPGQISIALDIVLPEGLEITPATLEVPQ
ncbi:hypothetical protein DC366_12660 [Pelagivirga sediminicola]|uniref:Uncharacterized protein n=1 Tax=Pelagivirga sediminicola TaxID=2170575 RepID=A0A2T7G586_9RHOB|nr:hypothetical protein [Pelagivirga sediminicola]PVA09547.1 hypothetical protein DC366_12660 [Pelagivirga sediminicola]